MYNPFRLALCVAVSIIIISASVPAFAASSQMLPPTKQNGKDPCSSLAGSHKILVWDGAGPLKCIESIKVTGHSSDTLGDFSIGNNLTVTKNATISGNETVTGNETVSGSSTVSGNATVSGTVTAVGGLVIPKVAPAAPQAGSMWLIP